MHLVVSFKNLRPREEVRRRAQALFAKLDRFLDPASEGTLVMWTEHGQCIVELTISSVDGVHQSQEEHEDLRTALDRTFHRIETALRRSKEKRVDRWHQRTPKPDGFVEPEAADTVASPATAVPPLVG